MVYKVIADTSVWINHFKKKNSKRLESFLRENRVYFHALVRGELLLGGLSANKNALSLLDLLPKAIEATHEEVYRAIEMHRLARFGIGWVDASLLSSAKLSGCELLTDDKRLEKAWQAIR